MTTPKTGPCWSCDAANSPAYHCERGHEWFCCDEVCGQKVEPNGVVDWDHCPECQDIYDADDEQEQEANSDKRHF